MPELIIKYEKPEILKILEALAEPLEFEIVKSDMKIQRSKKQPMRSRISQINKLIYL